VGIPMEDHHAVIDSVDDRLHARHLHDGQRWVDAEGLDSVQDSCSGTSSHVSLSQHRWV